MPNSSQATVAKHINSFHAALAIKRCGEIVPREEYLDYMTFRSNTRPLFTEIFGPLLGLKEEWAAQGALPAEIDLSAFRFRFPAEMGLPVNTGWLGGDPEAILEETADVLEVLTAMATEHGHSLADIVDVVHRKRAEKGGFGRRLRLDGVDPGPAG